MATTARVILNYDCERNCHYCVNNFSWVKDRTVNIPGISALKDFDIVCLTGGEPMLYAENLPLLIDRLRRQNPQQKIYLYTALHVPIWTKKIAELVDGIHFTLHSGATQTDIVAFQAAQTIMGEFPKKSFRLYISPEIEHSIVLFPNVWKRVEVKEWMNEDECTLPENETLFYLQEK
jgi:organic radical activating enzyme